MENHEQMRALVAWLVEHRFAGKQAKFCDALGMAPAWYSGYKKGTNCHGKQLTITELDVRFWRLRGALAKAQLPLEITTAGATPTAETNPTETNPHARGSNHVAAASAHASSATTPQQPANANVTKAPPILSVSLLEVKGAKEGGQVHLINLGVPVADARWQVDRPGGGHCLRLRDGLRGRRSFAARRGSAMGGRAFEWWVEPIDSRHDLAHHGGPVWVARELDGSISSIGQRIIGRFCSATGVHSGPSTPALLVKAVAQHCNVNTRHSGPAFVGLVHPSVQELLDTAADAAGLAPPEVPEEPTPRQLETLAADWANDLADAMANVLANGNAPPIVQLEQLQSHRGVVAGFSSEAELRAQQQPMLPYRERVQAQRQQKQQQLQQRQQERARERQQSQQQARTATNELSEYELQRDAKVAENKRKLHELFGPL